MFPVEQVCPTLISSSEDKDQFYDQLDTAIGRIPSTEGIGDFNARAGDDHAARPSCLGHSGTGGMNENGQRLLELCWYYLLPPRVSWRHPRSSLAPAWPNRHQASCTKQCSLLSLAATTTQTVTLTTPWQAATTTQTVTLTTPWQAATTTQTVTLTTPWQAATTTQTVTLTTPWHAATTTQTVTLTTPWHAATTTQTVTLTTPWHAATTTQTVTLTTPWHAATTTQTVTLTTPWHAATTTQTVTLTTPWHAATTTQTVTLTTPWYAATTAQTVTLTTPWHAATTTQTVTLTTPWHAATTTQTVTLTTPWHAATTTQTVTLTTPWHAATTTQTVTLTTPWHAATTTQTVTLTTPWHAATTTQTVTLTTPWYAETTAQTVTLTTPWYAATTTQTVTLTTPWYAARSRFSHGNYTTLRENAAPELTPDALLTLKGPSNSLTPWTKHCQTTSPKTSVQHLCVVTFATPFTTLHSLHMGGGNREMLIGLRLVGSKWNQSLQPKGTPSSATSKSPVGKTWMLSELPRARLGTMPTNTGWNSARAYILLQKLQMLEGCMMTLKSQQAHHVLKWPLWRQRQGKPSHTPASRWTDGWSTTLNSIVTDAILDLSVMEELDIEPTIE